MKSFKSKAALGARIFLGLVFTVFGLNGFLGFLPQPPLPEGAGAFIGGLAASGYLFPLLKGTEVLSGLLLLSNRFVPLALTVLAPITINIVFFHAVLAPGIGLPLLMVLAQIFLAYTHADAFAPLLTARHKVGASAAEEKSVGAGQLSSAAS